MEAVDPSVRVVLVDDESLVRSARPDVVLMDVRMPRVDGLTATEQVLSEFPAVKVIVLTTFDTDEFVLRAVRLGASGFLLKDTPHSNSSTPSTRWRPGTPSCPNLCCAKSLAR